MASLGLQSKYNKLLDMAMGQARDRHAAWKQQKPTYDPFSTSQSREYNARQQKKRDVKEMGLFQEGIDTRKQGLLGKQQLAQGAQLQLGQTNRANI